MSCQQCGGPTKKPTMKFCSRECKNKSQKGKREPLDSSKNIRCRIDGKIYEDYLNRSGSLTSYSKNVLGKEFDWNDWEIIDAIPKEMWNCPYCDWKTVDVENKSGWITVHLKDAHRLSPEQHCEVHSNDRSLWVEYWKGYKIEQFKNESVDNKIECKLCNKWFKGLSNTHLNTHGYSVEQYKLEFGDDSIVSKTTHNKLRESYYNNRPELDRNLGIPESQSIRKIQSLRCNICGKQISSVGMSNHLRIKHEMTTDEYVAQYGEFRVNQKNINNKLDSVGDKFDCKICGARHISDKSLTHHLTVVHNISKMDYVKGFIFSGIRQMCECGCGEEVSYLSYFPYKRSVISGHNKNPMLGRTHRSESKELMKRKAITRISTGVRVRNTGPELIFKEKLDKWGIAFEHQVETEFGRIDFYIPSLNVYVEIDGDFWHPEKIEKLRPSVLNSCIAQISRIGLENLIRIRASDLDKVKTTDDLYKYNFEYDLSIGFRQIIFEKSMLLECSNDLKKILVQRMVRLFRDAVPTFPYPPMEDNIANIVRKIALFDLGRVMSGNVFDNRTSSIGNRYLKSIFKSYWNSSYKGKKSPVDAWHDDDILKRVLAYRFGINASNETFNISLHQCLVGLSSARYTISFFKPVLAAAIYKHFLGDAERPIVFDPCAGFGGRLLGFKSIYPNGTYIGCEPNIDTYNELMDVASNFNDVFIYNSTLEDFDTSLVSNVDLSFTSIPYYDFEIYSNSVEYSDYDHWVSTFIRKLKSLPNLLVNIPSVFRNEFGAAEEYFIESNTSHFDKKTNTKQEFLLKLY